MLEECDMQIRMLITWKEKPLKWKGTYNVRLCQIIGQWNKSIEMKGKHKVHIIWIIYEHFGKIIAKWIHTWLDSNLNTHMQEITTYKMDWKDLVDRMCGNMWLKVLCRHEHMGWNLRGTRGIWKKILRLIKTTTWRQDGGGDDLIWFI
jgi:hypothetical protein